MSDNVNHSNAKPGEDVLDVVHRVMHQYRSLQYQRLKDANHGITHMDAKVLGFFARHPGGTQSHLAQHTGRDKAQLARLIKGLRDGGLLAAEIDDADRRNVRLSLSAAGHALQHALHQQARRLNKQAIRGLSAQESQQLLALMERVSANLDEG